MKSTLQKHHRILLADGTRVGEKIPGSRYERSVCVTCKEPIRVTLASLADYCTRCERGAPDNNRSFNPLAAQEYHGRTRLDT